MVIPSHSPPCLSHRPTLCSLPLLLAAYSLPGEKNARHLRSPPNTPWPLAASRTLQVCGRRNPSDTVKVSRLVYLRQCQRIGFSYHWAKGSSEVESLIARIKERVADPRRAVDSAAWVEPMPTVAAPATIAEVDSAESSLGFAIPTTAPAPLRRGWQRWLRSGLWIGGRAEDSPTLRQRGYRCTLPTVFEARSRKPCLAVAGRVSSSHWRRLPLF